jgi:hypothetical protein
MAERSRTGLGMAPAGKIGAVILRSCSGRAQALSRVGIFPQLPIHLPQLGYRLTIIIDA